MDDKSEVLHNTPLPGVSLTHTSVPIAVSIPNNNNNGLRNRLRSPRVTSAMSTA